MDTRIYRICAIALAFMFFIALLPTEILALSDEESVVAENASPESTANNASTASIEDQISEADAFWESIKDCEEKYLELNKSAYMQTMYNHICEMDNTCDEAWDDADTFSFTLSNGMQCVYDYDTVMTEKGLDGTGDNATISIDYGDAIEEKSNVPKDIFLIGPYYGYDSSFTDFYSNLANTLAEETGGEMFSLTGTNATPRAIRDRVATGDDLVILFDSHGIARNGSSYLCVRSSDGITSSDTERGWAVSLSSGVYGIDGMFITNGGTAQLRGSMVWMAICEGMLTDGMCTPLINSGAACVYGYSKSITFIADYNYAHYFWSKMLETSTVAEAAAYMKAQCGNYDNYGEHAYPIFVSALDPYPANVNAPQTVHCKWTLEGDFTYRISYNGNGGENIPEDQIYEMDYGVQSTYAAISNIAPWKFPYEFAGWAESSTGEPKYEPGEMIVLDSSLILYAIWVMPDVMSEGENELSVNYENTREHIRFTPQYTGNYSITTDTDADIYLSFRTRQDKELGFGTEMSMDLEGSRNYYLVFSCSELVDFTVTIETDIDTFTVTYDPNGGDSSPFAQSGEVVYTVPTSAPTRFAYNFMGWSLSPTAGIVDFIAGDSITPTENMVLYAVWKEAEPLVEGVPCEMYFTIGTSVAYKKIVPTVSGHYVISTGDACMLTLYNENAVELFAATEIEMILFADTEYYLAIPNVGDGLVLNYQLLGEIQIPKMGDANNDGIVNTADAVMILRYSAGLIDLNEVQRLCSDVAANGVVNTADAVAILRYAAGITAGFNE